MAHGHQSLLSSLSSLLQTHHLTLTEHDPTNLSYQGLHSGRRAARISWRGQSERFSRRSLYISLYQPRLSYVYYSGRLQDLSILFVSSIYFVLLVS